MEFVPAPVPPVLVPTPNDPPPICGVIVPWLALPVEIEPPLLNEPEPRLLEPDPEPNDPLPIEPVPLLTEPLLKLPALVT